MSENTDSVAKNTTIASEESTPTVVLTPKPVRTRAEQDTRIENDITEAKRLLAEIQASPSLLAFAQEKGFDRTRLTDGATLIAAAQHAYTARQTALGQMHTAAVALPTAHTAAYRAYVEFRETVRMNLPNRTDQQALGVTGKIPQDNDNFLTRARAGIEAAQEAPYAPILSKAGYNQAGLTALESILSAFATAKTAYTTAVGQAITATKARDDAYTTMRTFSLPLQRLRRLAQKKGIR